MRTTLPLLLAVVLTTSATTVSARLPQMYYDSLTVDPTNGAAYKAEFFGPIPVIPQSISLETKRREAKKKEVNFANNISVWGQFEDPFLDPGIARFFKGALGQLPKNNEAYRYMRQHQQKNTRWFGMELVPIENPWTARCEWRGNQTTGVVVRQGAITDTLWADTVILMHGGTFARAEGSDGKTAVMPFLDCDNTLLYPGGGTFTFRQAQTWSGEDGWKTRIYYRVPLPHQGLKYTDVLKYIIGVPRQPVQVSRTFGARRP